MSQSLALLALLLLAAGCANQAARGRPYIHKLELAGIRNISEHELRSKLAIASSPWYLHKNYLSPFSVADDQRRIEAYYHAHGYFDAHVTDSRVTPRRDNKAVDVRFSVDEGLPARIDAVRISGVDNPQVAGIVHRHVELATGQVFDHPRYLGAKENITGALKQAGYAFASVSGEVLVDDATHQVTVMLAVHAGTRARIRQVVVRGAKRIDAALLARLAAGGDIGVFSLDAVDGIRERAYQLGAFASVRTAYEQVPDHPDEVDVILSIEETKPNELRLGGGLGLESQRTEFHLTGRYLRHNFGGGLRTLELTLSPAFVIIPALWDPQRYGPAVTAEAIMTQPAIGFLSKLQLTVGYELGIEYAYQYHGPHTSLSLTRGFWHEHIQLNVSYNFVFLDFFNAQAAALTDPVLAGRLYGYVDPYRLAWLQETVALDLRDAPLSARRGVYLALTAEEGGVYTGSAFTYEKLQADVRGYIPISARVVLALRIQGGQMFAQEDLGTPITRRFYLGGPNSHRGFNYNRLSPQIPAAPGLPPLPVGGDQMFLAQAELRADLFTFVGQMFSMAAFWDAGDVATSVDIRNLHHAVGGGIRLKTLIGTIRFDVGVRLNRLDAFEANGAANPDPGARIAYHLSLGEAF